MRAASSARARRSAAVPSADGVARPSMIGRSRSAYCGPYSIDQDAALVDQIHRVADAADADRRALGDRRRRPSPAATGEAPRRAPTATPAASAASRRGRVPNRSAPRRPSSSAMHFALRQPFVAAHDDVLDLQHAERATTRDRRAVAAQTTASSDDDERGDRRRDAATSPRPPMPRRLDVRAAEAAIGRCGNLAHAAPPLLERVARALRGDRSRSIRRRASTRRRPAARAAPARGATSSSFLTTSTGAVVLRANIVRPAPRSSRPASDLRRRVDVGQHDVVGAAQRRPERVHQRRGARDIGAAGTRRRCAG